MYNILDKVLDTNLTELEKISLIEQLHREDIEHSPYELNKLVNKAIETNNLSVLGYCLSKSNDLKLENIFLQCVKEGFVKGIQLIAYQMNLSDHEQKNELIESSFLLATHNENYKDIFNFLIKKGGSYYFQDNLLFKTVFRSERLDILEYLIKSNLGSEDFKERKNNIITILGLENKNHIVNDWINSEVKVVNFTQRQPLKTVMHKKI